MESIWNLIETDKNGNAHYNQNKFNLILKCLDDKTLMQETSQVLNVGCDRLSSYIYYFNKLKEYFDIGGNIIELGFGEFPIMSFLIDHEQRKKINRGSITAYDGVVIEYGEFDIEKPWKTAIAPLGNIIYNFNHIDESTILPNYDLIFGIKTCNGLIDLVKKANQDKKDFFLVPCDCYPPEIINYLYNLAKKETDSNSELFIDDSYDKSYPILARRKR